ncbi:Aspartate-semialdehyde dehydrogenase [hydrothermal vent metagenome]|uniref:aspartate-semialdehyde dehydrogenase n=1 Tax=hydrothermal vent metagenome TaxID=652676 RepID=A0A3B1BWK8_9ZZZZ
MKSKYYNVAVAGATGVVGEEMIKILEQRDFPVNNLLPLASGRSAGMEIDFKGEKWTVQELTHESFSGIDIAFFSAGAARSLEFAGSAVDNGAIVIDNSSAFRMEPDTPLVVPEVNPEAIGAHNGIIANPNCSTIQMVVALKPLHDAAGVKRVIVSTYQAVSGAGREAMEELSQQTRDIFSFQDIEPLKFPHQIAFNCIPHIDVFLDDGYTKEEMKMAHETRKIMGDESIQVSATCVRVPVFCSHSESVNIEFERAIDPGMARDILSKAPGVEVMDDPDKSLYPLATEATGKDSVYVGRIRRDETVAHGLNMWVVSDQLRKGAALNAIQIAELLTQE